MQFSSLCTTTTLLACYLISTLIEVNASNIAATNNDISQYMVDAKHTVETAGEHRKNDLAIFLKTGKMPDVKSPPKKEKDKKVAVEKMKDIPTDVLMKQFIDGGDQIKQHLTATGRGRGVDKTVAPTVISTQSPVPSKAPKGGKGKKDKKGKDKEDGKGKSDPSIKEQKEGKKDGKKKKGGKIDYHSDYPSSSPTLSGMGDVSLPPNFDSGNTTNSSSIEQNEVDGGNGNTGRDSGGDSGDGQEDNGRSIDGDATTGVDVDITPSPKSSSVAKIVSPLAAFAGLILIAGVWISRRRTSDSDSNQEENLMKHTREGFDVENATVSGNTYRTGAFTEDDGTLEESVDVHAKENVHVMNELEEVSINDDGASTTSVSSGTHSATNSCDGSLIEAARAAMSAEAFQPDKSKVYDSSARPEWATRTPHPVPEVESNDECYEPLDTTSLRATSYKKFITSDPTPIVDKADRGEVIENQFTDDESVLPTLEMKVDEEVPSNDNSNTPVWMKTQLRPVSANSSVPRSEDFSDQTYSSNSEPEWMKKFKEMGLAKKE